MNVFLASCFAENPGVQLNRIKFLETLLSGQGHTTYTYAYDRNNLNDSRSFSQLSEMILKSNVYIAEMSIASQTLGFQIAFALSSTKPCLYLYHESTSGKPDAPLAAHPSRLLRIEPYIEKSLPKKLEAFLDHAAKQLNTARTSFMSTREIDVYLDIESARSGMHKAELIRQILHEHIEERAGQGDLFD